MSEECKEHLTKKPVFLPRGIRSYAKSPFGKMKQHNHYKAPTTTTTEEKDKADKVKDEAKDGEDAATGNDASSKRTTKDESNKESATEDEEMPSESEKG